MVKSEMEIIEISSVSSEKQKRVIKKSGCSKEDEDGTPLRPVFCLKRITDLNHFEEIEDCFILDFDPFHSVDDITKLSALHFDETDISVIAERGQVACRDYPHSRHLCLKFPFDTTPHESCCELCYCYVCDSAAPCILWTEPEPAHCHATQHTGN